MAIDENITRTKSMSASTVIEHDETNRTSTAPARMGHLLARKQRIEHWAYKGRSSSTSDTATTASAALGTVSAQKRSESTYSQAHRVLNIELLQLSERRQKIIERNNFDQKLFANKQALKHKDNQNILRTLSYVRKCCKYADTADEEKDNINPAIFLEEKLTGRKSRSRSPSITPTTMKRNSSANARTQTSASMAETFLRHNRKHLESSPINRKLTGSKTPTIINPSETPIDDDSQKRHVQFQIHTDGTHLSSQSAHVINKLNSDSVDKQIIRNVASANGIRSSSSSHETRTTNSAPLIRAISSITEPSNEQIKEPSKPKRSVIRINSAKQAVEQLRLHPERFLSASNRYLPLLRRQAFEAESRELSSKQQNDKNDSIKKQRKHISPSMSRLSVGSDLISDDAKSFLSEDNDLGKPIQAPAWLENERNTSKRFLTSNKLILLDTIDDGDEAERRMTISRLRDREYAHLNELIRSNPIEKILEPFSAIKHDEPIPIDSNEDKLSNYRRSSIDQSSSRIRQLNDILNSIDSLRCSDTVDRRARRQVDIEKNRAKLGILIF